MPFKNGREPANKKHLDVKLVITLYRSGLSTNKIGKQLGCHKCLVSNIVKKFDKLRFRTLSDDERATAVERYSAGESAPKIAEQLGVTSPAIYLALKKSGIVRRVNSDYSKEEAIRHDFFSKIDTREKAYWLGFLLTDGCVSRKAEIIIALKGIDAGHLALWRATVGSKRRITKSGKVKTFNKSRWFYKSARFVIKSNQMAADLFNLGVIPAKTGRTIYPEGIPEKLEADFWRGAVDGDGWLCRTKSGKRRQLVLGLTGDLPVLQAFQKFVVKYIPTKASIRRNGAKTLLKFQVTDSFAFTMAEILYGDAPVFLKRKHTFFLKVRRGLKASRSAPI